MGTLLFEDVFKSLPPDSTENWKNWWSSPCSHLKKVKKDAATQNFGWYIKDIKGDVPGISASWYLSHTLNNTLQTPFYCIWTFSWSLLTRKITSDRGTSTGKTVPTRPPLHDSNNLGGTVVLFPIWNRQPPFAYWLLNYRSFDPGFPINNPI